MLCRKRKGASELLIESLIEPFHLTAIPQAEAKWGYDACGLPLND